MLTCSFPRAHAVIAGFPEPSGGTVRFLCVGDEVRAGAAFPLLDRIAQRSLTARSRQALQSWHFTFSNVPTHGSSITADSANRGRGAANWDDGRWTFRESVSPAGGETEQSRELTMICVRRVGE